MTHTRTAMTGTAARLDGLRGATPPRPHNARTIAALTVNPGCTRRAILDAAGIDKNRLAAYVGHPPGYGQSQFAIARGNAFEARVKEGGAAELLRLLRDLLGLPIPEAGYDDLETVGGNDAPDVRHARTRRLIGAAAASGGDSATLYDHPLLRIDVGGRWVYLEPDLVAFKLGGVFHIVEIKSFPVVDGQADGAKVAAAATQSAVYVFALRRLLAELGHPSTMVSHNVVLVCPENFSNRPTATLVDIRKKLTVLERQLGRLARIDMLVDDLPATLTFDYALDGDGVPQRPAEDLVDGLRQIDARYTPECIAACELAYFCRREARGDTAALGRAVREELGGVERIAVALALASGAAAPAEDQVEAASVLRGAARLRRECLGSSEPDGTP